MKPLVVVSGQGLSLADGFNLIRELESLVPDCFAMVPRDERNDLDLVVTRLFDAADARPPLADPSADWDAAGAQPASRLLRAIERLAPRTKSDVEKRFPTTAELCRRLASIASRRLVVLFTTNVDRAARYGAVGSGANWVAGAATSGETTIEVFTQWLAEIARLDPGFHYLPLHGEPDLVSTGDGRKLAAGLPRPGWWTSLAEGLGRGTQRVDKQTSLAYLGYGLLKRLLVGAPHSGADPARAADLLVIGYGAGCKKRRDEYPFERTVDDSTRILGPTGRGSWAAISRWNHSERRCRKWFQDRGFSCLPVTHDHSCSDRIKDRLA